MELKKKAGTFLALESIITLCSIGFIIWVAYLLSDTYVESGVNHNISACFIIAGILVIFSFLSEAVLKSPMTYVASLSTGLGFAMAGLSDYVLEKGNVFIYVLLIIGAFIMLIGMMARMIESLKIDSGKIILMSLAGFLVSAFLGLGFITIAPF